MGETESAIERSRASAQSAFRAGCLAGHQDALKILIALMDEESSIDRKRLLMDACERISAIPTTPKA